MSKKKKKEATKREMLLQWLSILGALFTIPTLLPPVPWRYAQANGNMGARFSMYRYYSLFTLTNNVGQPVTWLKMRKDVCAKMEQFNRPNPLAMVVSAVATNVVGTGGAITGCSNWQDCKNHVSTRCTSYSTISVASLTSLFCILIGGICAVVTPLLLSQEASAGKKKKKKMAAKQSTMTCIIVAFVLNFLGVATWILLTQFQLKNLKSTGYYPYPPLFVGGYMACFGTFLLFLAMYCGITRLHPLFKDAGGEAGSDEEEEGGDAAFAQGMGEDEGPPPGALPPGMEGGPPPPVQ